MFKGKTLKIVGLLAVLVSIFAFSSEVKAASGTTVVSVAKCEQVGKDIRVTNKSNSTFTLTSSCRNAGYGLRQYELTCTSATQYVSKWHDGCDPVKDVTPPTVDISLLPIEYAYGSYGLQKFFIVNVAVSAYDKDSIISGVSLFVDGVFDGSVGFEGAKSKTLETKVSPNAAVLVPGKTYVLSVIVSDAAGNVSPAKSVTVNLSNEDMKSPTVSILDAKFIQNTLADGTKQFTYIINGSAIDEASNISTLELYEVPANSVYVYPNNGILLGTYNVGDSKQASTFFSGIATWGRHRYFLLARDVANNVGMSKVAELYVTTQ